MAYYRFHDLETATGHEKGYDRARGVVVGGGRIGESRVLQEAFTSENWIVRIYKLLDEPLRGVRGAQVRRSQERSAEIGAEEVKIVV